MSTYRSTRRSITAVLVVAVAGFAQAQSPEPPAAFVARIKATQAQQKKNLANFDDLDFNVYSRQKWPELARSHARDIVVHNADGSTTQGLAAHVEDLKKQFVFAPDTTIVSHPIRIADGNFTAVTGLVKGTFSQPMPIGDGKTIPATGKSFTITMATIGRWEKGLMKEEWLFMDSGDFMKQVGLAP